MPSVELFSQVVVTAGSAEVRPHPLPDLLQTPSGLAILEIQGTIHAPFPEFHDGEAPIDNPRTSVGRLEFPLFDPTSGSHDQKWMKRVYLYVGKHQRLTGEVKKLPKPLLVIEKRDQTKNLNSKSVDGGEKAVTEELEIIAVVRHKLLFGGRPEPVGD